MAGFLNACSLYRDRIRTATLRNWAPVSTQLLKNSRFLETRSRDGRIKPLCDRAHSRDLATLVPP